MKLSLQLSRPNFHQPTNSSLAKTLSADGEPDEKTSFLVNAIALAVWALFSLGYYTFVKANWPWVVPYGFLDLWEQRGVWTDWLAAGAPMFIWAVILNGVILFNTTNKPEQNRHAEKGFLWGLVKSIWAGVSEEILFRWLIFMGAFAALALSNYLFFGALFHFGVAEWFQLNVGGPLNDLCSGGYMHKYINNPENWMLGAAILSANTKFRDGHKYQGTLGLVNSWFAGLFLFYIMFNYGLLAAILVHALYDIICYTVGYLDCIIERAGGNA
ncbi:MAG: CPBP family intramembrane metalloprotease [Candidatus Obscuribacterales bacterium]|nr:CPBP family intramembrane metalloprotease [Candidatus Obscuribacterales bacterium]